ncbi:guanylate cyclase [Amylibacter sp. SFDW26]|uniref:heme NO-binding domain-containing protein n=1 Tax=Amylibacter sp. SFDW26 TaxID=2652722 RepID=UPI001261D4B4|nr:heme NO-binding domain-containing protein [Amylibacter sp. SFDW26]KAB7613786.1 guanylate cyclase [Amylibacter sp. SFDW26]
MKGVVFVELLNMAESIAGEEAVDAILDECPLENGGAFTAVGNYPCSELMIIVQAFSEKLDAPVSELQNKFGRWMFMRFAEGYPAFFVGKDDAFTMLESIEDEVHVEVRKLYPEVELPTFATERLDETTLKMIYCSERPLIDFCQGMIEACIEHFKAPAQINKVDHSSGREFKADFQISMAA